MYQVAQAVYQNGRLILNQKLSNVLEGQTLKVIIYNEDTTQAKKDRFFSFVDSHAFNLPTDYHFNRDELYAR